jgi:hypothetical protein
MNGWINSRAANVELADHTYSHSHQLAQLDSVASHSLVPKDKPGPIQIWMQGKEQQGIINSQGRRLIAMARVAGGRPTRPSFQCGVILEDVSNAQLSILSLIPQLVDIHSFKAHETSRAEGRHKP